MTITQLTQWKQAVANFCNSCRAVWEPLMEGTSVIKKGGLNNTKWFESAIVFKEKEGKKRKICCQS